MWSDGESFAVYDYEGKRGWFGKVANLDKLGDKGLFELRPDFLAAAMALEGIDPATTVMKDSDENKLDYMLIIKRTNGEKRVLYVRGDTHIPLKQVIYGKDGQPLLTVTYLEMKNVDITLPDGTKKHVFVASALEIKGREKDNYIKIWNTGAFKVNDDAVIKRAIVPVKFLPGRN